MTDNISLQRYPAFIRHFSGLSHRYRITDQYFGTAFVTLRGTGDALRVAAKKIVLKNDYIRQVVDIYHL